MHPRPTKNETPMLVPDLNRGTNAGMDRVDVNTHLDGTGKRHGTSQGPTKVIGRDRGTSQGKARQGKFIYIAHFIHSGNSKCFT